MQIRVSGQKIDLGQSIIEYATSHLRENIEKYFDHALDANAVFTKSGDLFSVTISVNEGVRHGLFIKATGEAQNVYICFDVALDKIVTRLRRYRQRIKDYQKGKFNKVEADPTDAKEKRYHAQKYILSHTHEHAAVQNPVISEKRTAVNVLSVDEAIMHMELASLPALLFVNKESRRMNLVYHRADGNISWVDPEL